MKRFLKLTLLVPVLIALLSACGTGKETPSGQPSATMHPSVAEKMAEPKLVYKDDRFEMKLNIDKTDYKAGEPIVYSASLTYIGEEESFTVWGSSSAKVVFTLTDGKGFDMEGASTDDLVPMEMTRGEAMEFPFVKSGGYGSEDPDAAFWKTFYSEKELLLPPGTYVISAICNFSLSQEVVVDSRYDGEVHTTVTVSE
ncbi:hypothetical protein RB620_29475 [Paenibacillus sp. LHD-117]|uniref:hypothetical protein n=1 Tax=Paenibacillus sp. LHD-117 TaxID=3071412 RepID=UPI0027E0F0DC|nr:hypothetical protein [Paenibacillus sp. LHD-117]MDQ6423547.1 hypothetical protein [Paenibacillus sp. LHD-117]